MPHLPRIHAPGLYYHVYARGNNKEPIFFEVRDYQRFLNNLEKHRVPLGYKIFAYCLLPNHFHLLVQVQSTPLTNIMQILMTAYTMYANKKYERVGHIFQGRYQAIIVDKDTYLLQVYRYIHLNPVKAGIVDDPAGYEWSSFHRYLRDSAGAPLLSATEILELFSPHSQRQKKLLQEFTMAGVSDEFDPLKDHIRGILGGPKLVQKLTKVLRGSRP